MSAWTIRPAAPGDISQVLALWEAAASPPSATDTREALDCLLRRDSDSLVLAEANGEIIGSLVAGWDGWRGSFYRLVVHPAWRRQGLATALIRAGEDRLRRLGAVRLTAIVAEGERAAMELWGAAGYRRQDGRSRFVRMVQTSSAPES
jgi:ribosomal protein S18 acetylase RimI-like enzyme